MKLSNKAVKKNRNAQKRIEILGKNLLLKDKEN